MTEPAAPAAPPLGVFARAIGMVFSPKATFQSVVAAPRPMGILLLVVLVIGVVSTAPQMTEAGRQAVLDVQLKAASRNGPPAPEVAQRMEAFSAYLPVVTFVSVLIFIPIVCLFVAALYWGFFNVALGGTATFKQVFSTVNHAQVIPALGLIAGLPFMLIRPTMNMGGPFNLGALVPMLEEGSRLAVFLGNLSIFNLWGVLVNAIGLGVLYRRKTTGIFIVLLIIHLGFTYLISMFRGA
jgi:Yip1 domain